MGVVEHIRDEARQLEQESRRLTQRSRRLIQQSLQMIGRQLTQNNQPPRKKRYPRIHPQDL